MSSVDRDTCMCSTWESLSLKGHRPEIEHFSCCCGFCLDIYVYKLWNDIFLSHVMLNYQQLSTISFLGMSLIKERSSVGRECFFPSVTQPWISRENSNKAKNFIRTFYSRHRHSIVKRWLKDKWYPAKIIQRKEHERRFVCGNNKCFDIINFLRVFSRELREPKFPVTSRRGRRLYSMHNQDFIIDRFNEN